VSELPKGIGRWLVASIPIVCCLGLPLLLAAGVGVAVLALIGGIGVGALALAAVIVLALQAFLNRTITGRAMQAVAQNTEAATVLGIDVKRMVLYVFLINALLAAVTALLVTPTYLAKFDMGDIIGLKAFYAAIIGGFNQARGALLGGVLVGVLENLTGAYLSPAYKEGVALMLFLIVILFKPEGLLGKAEERKV
jgi:branched-chain amino acid transport system permease protein